MKAQKLEIAKALCVFKKDCQTAVESNKALNIRTIVNTMKAMDIYVEEYETSETIETGLNANGNHSKRRVKAGKGIKFQLGTEIFSYNSNKQYAAYFLTTQLARINVSEILKVIFN